MKNFHKRWLFLFALVCVFPVMSFADDEVTIHDPAEYLSGTLPVLYVNTEGSEPITSKEYYLQGTCYLDANGIEGVESVGSVESPLPLQIKGRGNASWSYEKKPYRIKLEKKQSLLGMNKSKHWCLMAHHENGSFTNDEMGFQLSRMMGLEWTPGHKPVELVLNGDYVGLYFITEHIRVDKDRVNIVEQADEEVDPENITGGWLVEIDNHADVSQIVLNDGDGQKLRLTYHSPEVLSQEQQDYLVNLATKVDSLFYVEDKTSREWEEYVDLDALARFYFVNEVVDNIESFSGSCYWHKDRGADTKIIFGPVWDYGSAWGHWRDNNYEHFLYEKTPGFPNYVINHWISEIVKFPAFQTRVRELWAEFYPEKYNAFCEYIHDFANGIEPAVICNNKRWDISILTGSAYQSRVNTMFARLAQHVAFLDRMWTLVGDVNFDQVVNAGDISTVYSVCLGLDTKHLSTADVNGDGVVNVGDVTTIYQIILTGSSDSDENVIGM